MKKLFFLNACFMLLMINNSLAQSRSADSINILLHQNPKPDTNRVKLLNKLSGELRSVDILKSRSIAEEAYSLGVQLEYLTGQTYSLRNIGISYLFQGNFSKANEYLQKALEIAKKTGDPTAMTLVLTNLGFVQSNLGEYPKAIDYLQQALHIVNQTTDSTNLSLVFANLGQVYYYQGSYPQALDYTLQSLKISEQLGDKQATAQALTGVGNIYSEVGDQAQALPYLQKALKTNEELGSKRDISIVLNGIAGIYRMQGNYAKAIDYYQRAIRVKQELKSEYGIALNESRLADVFLRQRNITLALSYAHRSLGAIDAAGDKDNVSFIYSVIARASLISHRIDSAIYYGQQSLQLSQQIGSNPGIVDASQILADAYAQRNDFSNAYKNQRLYAAYRDSVSSDSTSRRVGLLLYNYDLEKKQAEITVLTKNKEIQAEANKRQRQFLVGTFIGLGLLGLMAIVLFRGNRLKQRANKQLTQQKEEINSQADRLLQQNKEINIQKDHLEKALEDLKSTQALLIQKEKMASLGELTAGIAHEIQNPLNFVNNFSEVNTELIEEMKTELKAGNNNEAILLANDIGDNEQKINHHGKRADAIVKGMLQHSSSSSGIKEHTDINALADEYLRLAYNGLRARDKDFNVTVKTDFDKSIEKINIVPQDIGRVFLNLYNNAFYAVASPPSPENIGTGAGGISDPDKNFNPTVWVSTKKNGDKVLISVRDNGPGIPQTIVDKIFQPFFTTKPTGQGTGLGLSLSYDIVKAHGGEIKVETKEGEGSEFIIQLPVV